MTLIDFCFFQARSKRDVGYFYTARYKEIQDDWNADYEADESQLEVPETLGVASSDDDDDDDDDGDDEEELFSASPEDEALADQELKSIVTRLLHNDSDFLTLNENIFLLYLRLMDVEAELNRSVAAVVQEAFETTDLPSIIFQQIEHFFTHYKDLEAEKWVRVGKWGNAAEARQITIEAIERYEGPK